MNELEIIDFPIQNWVKIIIILGTVLMLFSRLYIGDRFQYLFSFWNIHRYFHYKSGETISLFTPNNIIMFFLRILTTSLFLFMLFALIKAIVPRYRYDQLMRLGWKIFLPLSLIYLVLTASFLFYFDKLPEGNF